VGSSVAASSAVAGASSATISRALLVWSRLKHLAYQSGQTIYQIKHGLLHDYLVQQLKNPTVRMVLA
jgi:hypothetical protein